MASHFPKISPWLRFFRLPNLPTVPGDALAGAALALAVSNSQLLTFNSQLLTSLIVLFAYMFGLADNDIAGEFEDRANAPERPIPAGEITLPQARLARTTCLLAAVALAYFSKLTVLLPFVAVLLIFVLLYNRMKNDFRITGFFVMGLCRGMGLACGIVTATWLEHIIPTLEMYFAYAAAFLAWTLYTAAITWLASDEHEADKGMDFFRFIPGMAVLIPLATLRFYGGNAFLPILLFCVAAYVAWVLAVLPLGKPHNPDLRRRAVGKSIGALMLLQAGFILTIRDWRLLCVFLSLVIIRALMRHFRPKITGS